MHLDTMKYEDAIAEVRKECRQYAMLYFHFCKTLVEELGLERAKPIIIAAIFSLSIDRTNQLRAKAIALGLDLSVDSFNQINDLPLMGWVKEYGKNHCPYAECWFQYFEQYPWFKEIAPLYCNVIDTTNIENYTGTLSHELIKNVLEGADTCERVYTASDDVKQGRFTYGKKQT